VLADESLKRLLEIANNRALLPLLIRQVKDAGVIPFVGAGLSASYQLPQWRSLLENLATDPATRADVDRMLGDGEYEAAADLLMTVKGPRLFQIAFRHQFDVPIDVTMKTAVTSLVRMRRGPIITTNFDRVLEAVFIASGCPLDVVVGERPEQTREVMQFQTDALLKVHGDIHDPADRVLTKDEYDANYSRWLRVLLKNVATRSLLFLGCSLNKDRPMTALAELVSEKHVQTEHFALLSALESETEMRERSRQLAERQHILVIWYPRGEHTYVKAILDHIADELAPELRRNFRLAKRPLFRDVPEGRLDLFGRNSDELVELVSTLPVVVIEGNRGVGKTAFALQVLRRFMDRDTFGGLAWITASTRKEELQLSHVLDAISIAIDYPFKAQTRLEEKEGLLRKELDEVRNLSCLLLLDNYETVADPNIDAFVFDPNRRPRNLSVLLTSTGRLVRPGIRAFPLDELDRPSAIAMFRERCTRDGLPQEGDEDLARLYDVVGGNPLAIEWIVGQMREGEHLSDLVSELRHGKAEILTRVFQHSWDRLEANERRVLEAMTLFIRPALHDSLIAASGLGDEAFRASLKALTRLYLVKTLKLHDNSNLQLTGRRYFVHPFTRDFLQGQLGSGTCELYARAVAFYHVYVPERGGTPEREEAADIAQLNGERENILGVLDGCHRCNKLEPAYRLVLQMARWLFIESHWDDLERYGQRAVDDAIKLGDAHSAARILTEVGRTCAYRSEFSRAEQAFDRAQALAATPPSDGWAIAYVGHHRGEALIRQRRFAEADSILTSSLDGFQQLGSRRPTIGVRYRRALLALETRQFSQAKDLASRGVEDTVEEKWARLEGFNRRILGEVAVHESAFAEAEFQYRRALELVPRSDMRIQALIELSLAVLEHRTGRFDAARSRAARALVHFEKLRMPTEADVARRLAAGLPPSAAPMH